MAGAMHWQYTPYTLPLFLAVAMAIALVAYIWQRRAAPGATALMVLVLATAGWSLGYALELGGADLDTKLFWAKIQYLGIVTIPLAWLVFALQYYRQDKRLTPLNLALLTAIPLVTVVLVWTNEWHALIWTYTGLDASGPFLALDVAYGPWFWVHTVFAYLLLLLAAVRLFLTLRQAQQLYSRQSGTLLIGSLMPWVGNGLYLSKLVPVPNLDLTPLAFILSGIALAFGLLRFRLMDIVPVARRAIVDGMSDGLMVLDIQNRIVDLNPAAERLIGYSAAEIIGKPADQVLADHSELVEQYGDVMEVDTEITLWSDPLGTKFSTRSHQEEDVPYHYELHISPLADQDDHLLGRLVILHDITDRKRVEAALRAAREELEARVEERTAELTRLNRDLLSEIDERARAEEALRESEAKYRQLVQHAPAGIYEVDFVSLKLVSVNDVMCKYTGYSREEFLALNPLDLLTEESKNLFAERFQKALMGKRISENVEYKVKAKNGREFWTLMHTKWRYDQGQPVGATVVVYDITKRRRAEELIKTSLKEKEILLQEIHHRVKNNLQIISSLLNLQSDYIEDARTLEIFQDSQHRIRSMALIHEKLYQSESLAGVDFAEYIQDLAAYLFRAYSASIRGIRLDVRATENVYLAIDTAVPCGLILNELVTNSLQHAFLLSKGGSSGEDKPDGRTDEIRIEFSTDQDGQVTLVVSDNGIGLPPDLDFCNTTSLGLQLVNTLVRQLDAGIELDSGQDGTQFKITFKVPMDGQAA